MQCQRCGGDVFEDSALWRISDMAAKHLLARSWEWVPIDEVSPDDLADDDGEIWTFHSQAEAQAFCNGYRGCGGFALPFYHPAQPSKEGRVENLMQVRIEQIPESSMNAAGWFRCEPDAKVEAISQ